MLFENCSLLCENPYKYISSFTQQLQRKIFRPSKTFVQKLLYSHPSTQLHTPTQTQHQNQDVNYLSP